MILMQQNDVCHLYLVHLPNAVMYHTLLDTGGKNYPYFEELISVCVCVCVQGIGGKKEYRQVNDVTTLCSKYN